MNEKYLPTTPGGRRWHLAEEMAEVILEMSKLERFGPEGDDWCRDNKMATPRERLLKELDDLDLAVAAVRDDLRRTRP